MTYYEWPWETVWREEMKARSEAGAFRLFDDDAEHDFWEGLAHRYDERHRMDLEVPGLLEYLHDAIGEGKSVREIGPGTGNFTLPLARHAARWEAIDFSAAMLREAARKVEAAGYTQVVLHRGKWEEWEPMENADICLSVNSLYRVYEIGDALAKMLATTNERILLVRTLQYRETDAARAKGAAARPQPDFYILANFFWQAGKRLEWRSFPFIRRWYRSDYDWVTEALVQGRDARGEYATTNEVAVVLDVRL